MYAGRADLHEARVRPIIEEREVPEWSPGASRWVGEPLRWRGACEPIILAKCCLNSLVVSVYSIGLSAELTGNKNTATQAYKSSLIGTPNTNTWEEIRTKRVRKRKKIDTKHR